VIAAEDARRPARGPLLRRLATELGPLLVFFSAYWVSGLWIATGALMAATVLVTVDSAWRKGRLPIVPAVSTVIVLVTGGLTLALEDERFIKMRVTIVNGLYGVVLLGSLAAGRPLLKLVLADTIALHDDGWRGLTWRVGLFLVALAGANELVWRSFSTDVWVLFKVLGVVPLDIAFGFAMWPYVKRHRPADGEAV
jgi:intracellular septation protein